MPSVEESWHRPMCAAFCILFWKHLKGYRQGRFWTVSQTSEEDDWWTKNVGVVLGVVLGLSPTLRPVICTSAAIFFFIFTILVTFVDVGRSSLIDSAPGCAVDFVSAFCRSRHACTDV